MHPGTFVYARYAEERSAVRAVEALVNASFPTTDVGAFILSAKLGGPDREIEVAHTTGIPVNAALGALLGVSIGMIAGVVSADGARAVIEGAVAGGAFGTLAGALGGLAFWRDTMTFPPHSFKDGAVLVGVNVHEGRIDEACDVLKRAGGNGLGIANKREVLGIHRVRWARWDRPASR